MYVYMCIFVYVLIIAHVTTILHETCTCVQGDGESAKTNCQMMYLFYKYRTDAREQYHGAHPASYHFLTLTILLVAAVDVRFLFDYRGKAQSTCFPNKTSDVYNASIECQKNAARLGSLLAHGYPTIT